MRKPLNHWSRGFLSGRLECHGSGWIPDLTRCEAIPGFRILSAASEFPADCSSMRRSIIVDAGQTTVLAKLSNIFAPL